MKPRVHAGKQGVRPIADLAMLAGMRQRYLDALQTMLKHLRDEPLQWGDPLYRTKHEGGIVCHACIGPILVRYVAYEAEQMALIIDIKPLFEWPIRP